MRRWWHDDDVRVEVVEGKYVALSGWNGFEYLDCWYVEQEEKNMYFENEGTAPHVKPVYQEDPDDEDFAYVCDYEFI